MAAAAAAATATTTTTSTITTTTTTVATVVADSSSSPRTPNKNNRGVLSSPWAQVVKGAVDSPEKSQSPPPDNLSAGEGNVGKKPVWKKPVNAISISPPPPSLTPPSPPSGGDHGGGGVMGAVSWPALSESTRLKPSSSFDSSKSALDVPSQGPVTSHPQQSKTNVNTNQYSSMNTAAPTRQRSMKRGGNRQGGFPRGPPPPPPLPSFTIPEIAQSSISKGGSPRPDSSLRESWPTGGFASHSNPSNENNNHRGSNRRGNFGQYGRGDGRNNHHGGRRDQDHGNHDWSSSPSPRGRGAHGHPPHRTHGRGFIGPPVQGAPSFAPPPVIPYGTLIYPDPALVYYIPSLPTESFRGPYFTGPSGPPPPPYLVMSDPLRASIIKQIEYYFSDANLVKDEFLRSKMDEQGWVPITLIASFPRVQNLTDNVLFILDCLRGSTVVEVQGDKVRRSDEWLKWIKHQQFPSDSGIQSSEAYNDNMTMSRMSLEDNRSNTSSALMEKEMTNNLRGPNIEGSVQRVC